MTHPRHIHVSGGTYLVSAVAARNRELFVDDDDRIFLGSRTAQVVQQCSAQVLCYSWLPSELLLVLQVSEVPVSEIMRLLLSSHARRLNRRLRRKDALFRHPHRQILLGNDNCLLEAILTVHQQGSSWSSHRAYLGETNESWVAVDPVLRLITPKHSDSIEAYIAFAEARPRWSSLLDQRRYLVGNVPSLRAYDAFARWLKAGAFDSSPMVPLDLVVLKIADWLEISTLKIESTAKDPLHSLARALIAFYAMKYHIASLRDLALRFKRARSTVWGNRDFYQKLIPALFDLPLETVLAGPSVSAREIQRLLLAARRKVNPTGSS